MSRQPSDSELKAEFSAQIRQILGKFSAQDVATALHVKRQTVYNYRDGRNAPSPEVIRHAMETWPDFELSYRGKVLTLQDYPKRRPNLAPKRAIQFELWDAIKKLDSESIEIEILKKETSSVQLGVQIHFKSR